MNPLSLYGLGYVDPRLQSDSEDYNTGNVLAMMPRAQGWDRDEILPFAREVGGRQVGANPQGWGSSGDVFRHLDQKAGNNWKLAAPGMLYNALAAGAEVGNAPIMGGYPMGAESREHMTDAAGAVVGPQVAAGFMRAAMAPRGGSELGAFGGRVAAERMAAHGTTGPKNVLDMLPIWEAQGKTPQEIWALGAKELQGTSYAGPKRGADGKERFEWDDSHLTNENFNFVPQRQTTASHMYPHEMYRVYHDKSKVDINSDATLAVNDAYASTRFVGDRAKIALSPNLTPEQARTAYLHELTHALPQRAEGFARGGSMFDPDYARLAGELEALQVGERRNLTADQRRAAYPEDAVPASQQVVRFGDAPEQNSFGGRLAKTADHAKLALAEKMDAAGTPREQIWNDTGWFKGSDGKWRFEIDDSKAAMNYGRDSFGINQTFGMEGPMSRIFTHDNLYGAYPDIATIKGDIGSLRNGTYYTPPSIGQEKITVNAGKDNRAQYTLHEAQHAIQTREGFAPGASRASSPSIYHGSMVEAASDARAKLLAAIGFDQSTIESIPPKMKLSDMLAKEPEFSKNNPKVVELLRDIEQTIDDAARGEGYNRTAGEVEARAVEARQKLTPDQRKALPPWKSYDVPEDQHIVRGSAGTQQKAEPVASFDASVAKILKNYGF